MLSVVSPEHYSCVKLQVRIVLALKGKCLYLKESTLTPQILLVFQAHKIELNNPLKKKDPSKKVQKKTSVATKNEANLKK